MNIPTDSLRHLFSLEIVEPTEKSQGSAEITQRSPRNLEFTILSCLYVDITNKNGVDITNKNGSCVFLPSGRSFTIRTSTILASTIRSSAGMQLYKRP
jgi:hypothetical protein